MKKIAVFLLFLAINFLGLYLGGLATGPGVQSEWYQNLNQAPWTPPGFVFGIVWTLIGITWSVIGTHLYFNHKEELDAYFGGWLLNLVWNPFFFIFNKPIVSGIVIILLALSVFYNIDFLRKSGKFNLSLWGYLYFFWLMIATSLNWYIIFMN